MKYLNKKNFNNYYGCRNIAVVFLISAFMSGVIVYGFTALLEPLSNAFGWSYTEISFAASIRGLETGLLTPVIGLVMDRYGARKLILTGVIAAGLGLLLFNFVNSLWMFYGLFFLMSLGTSTAIGAVPQTLVGLWFVKKLPLAISVVVCGSAVGGLLVPAVAELIEISNWKMALTSLGAAAWILLIPLSLLIRDKPAYSKPYIAEPSKDNSKSVQETTKNVSAKQVLKRRSFWLISIGLMCHVLAINATVVHIMPYFSTINITAGVSSVTVGAVAICGILGRLSFGWFGDRFDKKLMLAFGLFLAAISLLIFNYIQSAGTWSLVLFIILFGIGFGGPVSIITPLVKEHFGTAHLGTVLGLAMGIMTLGNLIGPPLAGWFYDSFGNYNGLWLIFALVLLFGMITLLFVPKSPIAIDGSKI